MIIFFLLIIIALIAVLLFLLIKELHLKSTSNYIMTFFLSLIILFIILKPEVCIASSISGAKLFFFNVFPYVFPFLVISNLIICYDGIEIYSKFLGPILCSFQRLPKKASIVLIISILCGYPLGAKYASDLYEDNIIDFSTFRRLVNIASNPGPLFIIGAIGTSMLKNKHLGYILLISCYLSCIVMGLILPNKKVISSTKKIKRNVSEKHSFGIALKISTENAVKVILQIMSFIIIFSVIIGLLKQSIIFKGSETSFIKTFMLGIIEMTNGANMLCSYNFPIDLKMITLSFFASFGGLCIIAQIYSFIGKYKISYIRFTLLKVVQGIISSIICFILMKLFYVDKSISTFNLHYNTPIPSLLFIAVVIIILLPLLIYKLKKII
ncbi:sporulation integral membrane protein YlbJ [Clostridium felsineum]|uniref:sporulation integral membrane protein YlbJ n=1 Tax=Clostridium felsineum TaxID=36839 RepID=UPI00098CA135|nr:sporulation integral membrane protein YlbJ [Clostridium felsineum]URZ16163.1 Sporulation integral membrane protein YlbJ [Clostridium felsineum DSM 794]